MKRNIFLLTIGLCLIFCVGCYNTSSTSSTTNNGTVADIEEASELDSNNLNTTEDIAQMNELDDDTPDESAADKEKTVVEPDTIIFSAKEACGNSKFQIACNGMKQYDFLGSQTYTDTPSEDNVYLVLFLNITNYEKDDLYFSAESLSTTVDGTEISHTFLVNDPEGYPSLFGLLPANASTNGYIVWEVPKDWKKLSFHYTGWADVLNVIIDGTLTPDNFVDPVSFENI